MIDAKDTIITQVITEPILQKFIRFPFIVSIHLPNGEHIWNEDVVPFVESKNIPKLEDCWEFYGREYKTD